MCKIDITNNYLKEEDGKMNKRYSADKVKIEKLRSKKMILIIVAVAAVLLFIYGIYKCVTLDDYNELERYFNAEEVRTHAVVGLLCAAGGFGIFFGAIIQLLLNRPRLNNLLQSYIQLDENKVQGLSFTTAYYFFKNASTPFSVPYSSIQKVTVNTNYWQTSGLNLTIESNLGTFKCLEIEQPYEVANEINEMIKARKEAKDNT